MSTHSRPTSSSTFARSPLPEPPSCSSSSSFSSSSSSNKVVPVRVVGNVASPTEKVRGDDAGNASDRSASRERPRPHVGPAWVDPKVCKVASFFHTDASVAEFLNEVPVLKASTEESLLAFGPCSLEDRVYRERSSTDPPFFFYLQLCFFGSPCVPPLRCFYGRCPSRGVSNVWGASSPFLRFAFLCVPSSRVGQMTFFSQSGW